MPGPSRLLGLQDRRQFMTNWGLGLAAAAVTSTGATASAQEVPPADVPIDPAAHIPTAPEIVMRRPDARPVTNAREISVRGGRIPMIYVTDETGEPVFAQINYGSPRLYYSQRPASIPPSRDDDFDFIGAQRQFTASTTKIIALIAYADWVREQTADELRRGVAQTNRPADPLLHLGLEPYANVLARRADTHPVPVLPRGAVRLMGGTFATGAGIDYVTGDEALSIGCTYSANDCWTFIDRIMGGQLRDYMRRACTRFNMTDSSFPTANGLAGSEGRARIDCRSTAAEMTHAMRMIDQHYPEFAGYLGRRVYRPVRLMPHLRNLRDGGIRPAAMYLPGPGQSGTVVQVAARVNEPLIDPDTGRDLNAAYDPARDLDGDGIMDPIGEGDSDEPVVAPPEADAGTDDEDSVTGIPHLRLIKTGKVGSESRRTRQRNETALRTAVFAATRVVNGQERTIYGWISADTQGQRLTHIHRAVDRGFAALESRPLLQIADRPAEPVTPGLQGGTDKLTY